MEQTPPVPPQGTSLFEMEIDAVGQSHLKNISGWGKFIAITGLIIVALAALGLASKYEELSAKIASLFSFDSNEASILMVVLAVFGCMLIILFIFLLRAGVLIKQGLVSQNSDRIADGFKSLKIVFTISIIWSALTLLGTLLTLFNL